MQVEIWRDADGFRVDMEGETYEFTDGAFYKLASGMTDAIQLDPDADNYRCILLDLPEAE